MNSGSKLELDFVKNINKKKFCELSSNFKSFILFLFNEVKDDDLINCTRINSHGKVDLIIKLNDKSKNISIKTGSQNSVHTEKIETFVDFLRKIDVKEEMIEYLLLYHFGDGTTDGSGNKRLNAEELKLKYRFEIRKFNYYINKHVNLSKIIDRVLFSGLHSNKSVDVLYYGNIEYGVWCSKESVIKYFTNHQCFYMDTPHFSSLTFQNWCRNLNKNEKMESHRYYIQIKWFTILSDINKISLNEKEVSVK